MYSKESHFLGDKFRFLIFKFFWRKGFWNISAINRGLSVRARFRLIRQKDKKPKSSFTLLLSFAQMLDQIPSNLSAAAAKRCMRSVPMRTEKCTLRTSNYQSLVHLRKTLWEKVNVQTEFCQKASPPPYGRIPVEHPLCSHGVFPYLRHFTKFLSLPSYLIWKRTNCTQFHHMCRLFILNF